MADTEEKIKKEAQETKTKFKKEAQDTKKKIEKEVRDAKKEIEGSLKEIKQEIEDNKDKQNYFIAGGVLGAVGMLLCLAMKSRILGVAVIVLASLIIAYGLCLYFRVI